MQNPGTRGAHWSQAAWTYLYQLLGEHLSQQPGDTFNNRATDWGNTHEPEARARYVFLNEDIAEMGFVSHPSEQWIGCSPDGGSIDGKGLIEIKSPYTTKEHIRTMSTGKVPAQYVPQVQGQLWITQREWCDFVSYDPRMKNEEHKMFVIRCPRDEEYIGNLSDRVIKFRDLMLTKLGEMK